MVDDKEHSTLFGALIGSLLSEGLGFRFRARGRSMQPTIQDGEILHVKPVSAETLRKGDIVLFAEGKHFRAHRLVVVDPNGVSSSRAEMQEGRRMHRCVWSRF